MGGVTVHYNKEIKTIIKLTRENGDVVNITNDMSSYNIDTTLEINREYVTKLEVFSGVENNRYDDKYFEDWYRLQTIVIHEGVKYLPFNFTYDRYSCYLNKLVIYGKDINYLFYHGNVSYLYRDFNTYTDIYVDKSNVKELENYKNSNNLNYYVYSLDKYHDEIL